MRGAIVMELLPQAAQGFGPVPLSLPGPCQHLRVCVKVLKTDASLAESLGGAAGVT